MHWLATLGRDTNQRQLSYARKRTQRAVHQSLIQPRTCIGDYLIFRLTYSQENNSAQECECSVHVAVRELKECDARQSDRYKSVYAVVKSDTYYTVHSKIAFLALRNEAKLI